MPGQNCPICLSLVAQEDALQECPVCHTEYHAECWTENGGCAVYGCAAAPPPAPRESIEIPVSYWGQEHKPCPACGKEILAAATRCRHCGAMFDSARPQDSAEFSRRTAQQERVPQLKRSLTILFVLSLLPCSAPFAAIFGAIWYPRNREDIRALPTVFPALCKIGLITATCQTLILVVMSILYAMKKS